MSDDVTNKAPPMPFGLYTPGRRAAAKRMEDLGYDPLSKAIQTLQRLEAELTNQEKRRSGELVVLGANGKERYYKEEVHLSIYDKLLKAQTDLMKYVYSPAPKDPDEEPPDKSGKKYVLEIALSKEGDVFTIGGEEDEVFTEAKIVSEEVDDILKQSKAASVEPSDG